MKRLIKRDSDSMSIFILGSSLEIDDTNYPIMSNLNSVFYWDNSGEHFKSKKTRKIYNNFINRVIRSLKSKLGIYVYNKEKGTNASSVYLSLAATISKHSKYYIGLDFDYRFIFYIGLSSHSQNAKSKKNGEVEFNNRRELDKTGIKRLISNPKLNINEKYPIISDDEYRIVIDDKVFDIRNVNAAVDYVVNETKKWMDEQLAKYKPYND